MRIPAMSETVRSVHRVHEKQDTDAQSRDQGQQQQRQKKDDGVPADGVTDDKVDAAIVAFSTDGQNRASGIKADKVGHGPGLKVVLRDGTGTVIRQLTGEEFLKVRAAADDGRLRGKILDQKL